jgi:hypothetical protein
VITVPAISAHIPFTGRGTLAFYQPSSTERYFSVGPGIEVSLEPYQEPKWDEERGNEATVYNGWGRLNHPQEKGAIIDLLR